MPTETTPLIGQLGPDRTSSFLNRKSITIFGAVALVIFVFSTAFSATTQPPKLEKDSFLVSALPGETNEITASLNKQYAGYIPVTNDGYLFFWHFPSMNVTSNRLVIWINGGPGCSSMIGQFTENGPFSVSDEGSLAVNKFSWHNNVNMLYVDQPTGAGFSFTKPKKGPHDEYEVGAQFHTFLRQFYLIFPETQGMDLFITGESYAGVYVPWIAKYIVENPVIPSKDISRTFVQKETPTFRIKFKGIGIGNPVLSYKYQFQPIEAFEFLHATNFFKNDSVALREASNLAETCRYTSDRFPNSTGMPFGCSMYRFANDWGVGQYGEGYCLDRLNINLKCVDDSMIGGPMLSVYLDRSDVRKAIHVDPLQLENGGHIQWKACDQRVDNLNDTALPEPIEIIPQLIASGIKCLVYEGDLDLSINYIGTERSLSNMTWSGKQGMHQPLTEYRVDGVPAGLEASERGLSYLRVYQAGHLVPTDQPARGADVLQRIINQ
ncbi:hypothetical protein CcCBS67573_g01860 [Chytriomyces confervae]|uniref:Carboxypeptidase n=1 Tax=Chytriomyces confervae TaxID=246404 RepID=A0A507FNE9_9FUNG|nr:hypothetical protein CcCBS67573_g01860 [Chytriomyces confervae]